MQIISRLFGFGVDESESFLSWNLETNSGRLEGPRCFAVQVKYT